LDDAVVFPRLPLLPGSYLPCKRVVRSFSKVLFLVEDHRKEKRGNYVSTTVLYSAHLLLGFRE
jgi:hypothetical protein